MVKTYFYFIVEEKINELLFLVERIDESTLDDSKVKTKMDSFVKFALSKGEKAGLSIINFFLEKIRKNKKAAFALLSVLFFSAGLSLNTIFGGLSLTTSEQEYVKGLTLQKPTDSTIDTDIKSEEETPKTSIVEIDDEETVVEIDDEETVTTLEEQKLIDYYKSKGYKVVDPSKIRVGKPFDKKNTIFTNASFPYEISKNATKGVLFKYENQADLIGRYIPELDRITSDEKIGLKLLALAMTYMEGYIKRDKNGNMSVSYSTNNPGNIGNTDDKRRHSCKNLEEGINLQINYIKDVAYGIQKNYPLGKIKSHPPYYSKELKKIVPGYIFLYEGTLEQFLKIYATGPRDNNNYLNVVLTFFETYMPGKITPKTKIKDIINMGGDQRLIDLIQKSNTEVLKSMSIQMSKNGFSINDISEYTGLSKQEVKDSKAKPTKEIKQKKKSVKKPYLDFFGFSK